MSTVSNLGYLQIIESTAKPFFSDDGKLKTRLCFSALNSKVALIAAHVIPFVEEPTASAAATAILSVPTTVTCSTEASECKSYEATDLDAKKDPILTDPNWAYIRTRSDGSKVFIRISSAAKRLFKTEEEIREACTSGSFKDLFMRESGLYFAANIRKASNTLDLTPDSLDFVLRNKEHLIALAQSSDEGYIYEKFKKFPRPLEVRSDGTILVHFTKTLSKSKQLHKGDLCFGKGSFKKARAALLFNGPEAGSLRLITSFNVSKFKGSTLNADHEALIHTKVKDCPGILRLNREYKVLTSKHEIKSFMDLELCECGELFESVTNDRLTSKDKCSITLDLLDGMVSLHDAGIIHRDIKLENIFLKKRDGRLRAKIGDFGLACLITDTARKRNNVGSPDYVDPNYFQAVIEEDADLVEALTTHKLDMYSFGATLYAMCFKEYFKGALPKKTADIDIDPLYHLISECLVASQDDRIGPKEAHEKYFARIKALFDSL